MGKESIMPYKIIRNKTLQLVELTYYGVTTNENIEHATP